MGSICHISYQNVMSHENLSRYVDPGLGLDLDPLLGGALLPYDGCEERTRHSHLAAELAIRQLGHLEV